MNERASCSSRRWLAPALPSSRLSYYIRAGGNKGLEEGAFASPPLHILADQLNLYQLCLGGGQIMPIAIQLAHQIFRPSACSAVLYVGSVH